MKRQGTPIHGNRGQLRFVSITASVASLFLGTPLVGPTLRSVSNPLDIGLHARKHRICGTLSVTLCLVTRRYDLPIFLDVIHPVLSSFNLYMRHLAALLAAQCSRSANLLKIITGPSSTCQTMKKRYRKGHAVRWLVLPRRVHGRRHRAPVDS